MESVGSEMRVTVAVEVASVSRWSSFADLCRSCEYHVCVWAYSVCAAASCRLFLVLKFLYNESILVMARLGEYPMRCVVCVAALKSPAMANLQLW